MAHSWQIVQRCSRRTIVLTMTVLTMDSNKSDRLRSQARCYGIVGQKCPAGLPKQGFGGVARRCTKDSMDGC
jgi:hypothetical protein